MSQVSDRQLSIELKYRIPAGQFPVQLPEGTTLLKEKADKDIYFDTEDYVLFKAGNFLRTRNNKILEFKLNVSDDQAHDHCLEVVFDLPFKEDIAGKFNDTVTSIGLPQLETGETWEAYTMKAQLKEFVVVDKKRTTYEFNGYEICIDEVDKLGKFLEVDYMTEDMNVDVKQITKEIEKLLATDLEPVSVGYVELLLKESNPEVYKIGKYQ